MTSPDRFTDVRTKSTNTAAMLILLGHQPTEVVDVEHTLPVIVFPKSAERDLRRFLLAKEQAEGIVRIARLRHGGGAA